MNKIVIHIISFCMLLLFSCSKDKDVEKPIISMSSPIELQQISGGDNIMIIGTISDDKNIELVTVTLRDNKNTPVLSAVTRVPSESESTSYQLELNYFFDDVQLVSGQYEFNITAFDGENTTTKYISILYSEFEKKREGIFVIGNSGNFSNISLLNNNFSSRFYKSISGDFIGASVDLSNQQLINVAKTVGSISASVTLSGNEIWSFPVPGSYPTPYYTGFYFHDQNIYLGKRNGGVQGYDKNGNPNFSTGTSTGLYMECAVVHDDEYFVMEEKPIVFNNTSKISLSWLYSGIRIQQTTINSDVKGIYSSTKNTLVILANDASLNAKVIFYDIPTGGLLNSFNISSLGEIDDCLEISNGVYLVAASDDLKIVNINNHSTLGYLNGIPADKIWFDNLANELYVAYGSSLSVYDFSSRMLKGSYSHTEKIEEVLFWYNK